MRLHLNKLAAAAAAAGKPVPDGEGIYLCDAITSPFVFGIVKPKIYLPFDLDEEERQWVLLHERSHIIRRDFLLKPLFWLERSCCTG